MVTSIIYRQLFNQVHHLIELIGPDILDKSLTQPRVISYGIPVLKRVVLCRIKKSTGVKRGIYINQLCMKYIELSYVKRVEPQCIFMVICIGEQ